MKELLKKCLVEFIGTFFIMFTIGCAMFPNSNNGFPPMAIGFIYIAMIYAGYHISGGHYNPAVSLAATIRGVLRWRDFAPYIASQFLGGFLGALLTAYIVAIPPFANDTSYSMIPMAVCEFIFTFILCYTVLSTTTSKATKGNSYYGLAIGSVILVGLLTTVGTCYGAFNPAVALGMFVMKITHTKLIAATILSNFLAGAAAAGTYKVTSNG